MKLFSKSFLGLLLISSCCYAGWPQFKVLDAEQVRNLMDLKDCPTGYGKIPFGSKIEILNRYIPHNEKWYWIFSGDSECKKLASIKYLDLSPKHMAVYSGGKITTFYGANKEDLFSFTFTVPAGNCPENSCPWNCGSFAGDPPHEIGCSQDMNKD